MGETILFCGLETYSLIGGIQAFNRRVIRHLAAIATAAKLDALDVVLRNDRIEDCPATPGVRFKLPGASRVQFAREFLRSLPNARIVFLGHVNLLPFGLIARVFRPALPIVLFVHGEEVWDEPGARCKRWYEPALVRCLTRIAAVSEYTGRRMTTVFHAPSHRITHFPNGADRLSFEPGPLTNERQILTVTRIGPGDRRKHVDKALRAFAIVLKTYPDAVYEIVGDGALLAELRGLAGELGVSASVRFLGRATERELRDAYRRARVFLLPSSKEGFGIVYLEAWQYGLPVICSVEGAASEIVTDGADGYAVDPNRVEQIAERLLTLLSNAPIAPAFGERGRAKVEGRYLDSAFAGRLNGLYSELTEKR